MPPHPLKISKYENIIKMNLNSMMLFKKYFIYNKGWGIYNKS